MTKLHGFCDPVLIVAQSDSVLGELERLRIKEDANAIRFYQGCLAVAFTFDELPVFVFSDTRIGLLQIGNKPINAASRSEIRPRLNLA